MNFKLLQALKKNKITFFKRLQKVLDAAVLKDLF